METDWNCRPKASPPPGEELGDRRSNNLDPAFLYKYIGNIIVRNTLVVDELFHDLHQSIFTSISPEENRPTTAMIFDWRSKISCLGPVYMYYYIAFI